MCVRGCCLGLPTSKGQPGFGVRGARSSLQRVPWPQTPRAIGFPGLEASAAPLGHPSKDSGAGRCCRRPVNHSNTSRLLGEISGREGRPRT